jgi:hypothetical protein
MARITGIGGVFFKSKGDRAALAAWYQKHLGMPLEDFGGAVLRWGMATIRDKMGHCHFGARKGFFSWYSLSRMP